MTIEERNELVENNLYLVDILIRKYLNKGVEYDDLYQVGAMALVKAADRFNAALGNAFSTFATPTILGEIKRYFRDKEWGIRVPRMLKEISLKIPAAKEALIMQLQRMPSLAELADYMEISQDQLFSAMESGRAYNPYSLDQTFDEEGAEGDSPALERFTARIDKGYENIETAEIIGRALQHLSETETAVFRKRFMENKTQDQIAGEIGVSQMTISRIEKNIRLKFSKELAK